MRRTWLAIMVTVVVLVAGACGDAGSGGLATSTSATQRSTAPAIETRWLRGLWATDIRDALATIGFTCKGPMQENRTNVWMCETRTPLVSYQVRFYGSAPGKIEYINAVVTQSGPAKDAVALRMFGVLAGLHFDGADPAKAREWLQASMADGGNTIIGPAKYKLAGDSGRRTFDIKAGGSEW
ncbi:MAG TPA: hypothetical protein VF332_05035 [Vicinamibacterales bacterium]